MTDQRTCPRCDSPITDTAYVCTRCAQVLTVALRNAANNWDELEAAVARQVVIPATVSPPGGRYTLHGPTDIPCFHDSCLSVRKSQLRAMWTVGSKADSAGGPIPGEKSLISVGAMEDAWDVTNTATTWARLIEEESGKPIPPPAPPAPKRADPKRVIVAPRAKPLAVVPAPKAELCDFSWLPIESCACGHPHPMKERA